MRLKELQLTGQPGPSTLKAVEKEDSLEQALKRQQDPRVHTMQMRI